MDIRTGEIKYFNEGDNIPNGFIEIKKALMTEKQEKTMQVSKHDNKSELGITYKKMRKKERKARLKKANRNINISLISQQEEKI